MVQFLIFRNFRFFFFHGIGSCLGYEDIRVESLTSPVLQDSLTLVSTFPNKAVFPPFDSEAWTNWSWTGLALIRAGGAVCATALAQHSELLGAGLDSSTKLPYDSSGDLSPPGFRLVDHKMGTNDNCLSDPHRAVVKMK